MNEDDIEVSILRRARTLNRWLTLGAVGIGTVATFAMLYLYVDSPAGGAGRGLGVYGGKLLAATFVVTVGASWFLGRRLVVSRLRAWTDEAIASHGLERGSLDYLVAMYAKAPSRANDLDVDSRRR